MRTWHRRSAPRIPPTIAPGESRQIIRLLEQEVRLGYWPHLEFDWTNAARTTSELAAEHSLSLMSCKGVSPA